MDTITDTAEKVSRTARRTARSKAKDLTKTAKRATKAARGTADDLMAAAKGQRRRRRRWPWLVGLAAMAAGAAGTAYAMRGKPQTEPVESPTSTQADTDGVAPHPRREQPMDSSANHR